MKKTLLLALLTVSFFIVNAQDIDLLRMPAISPDGQKVAFSYQGDIWTMDINGSDMQRMTIHEGYESNPVWSPDGKHLAFTSSRYGNTDVFTIPSNGGVPKRLTYNSSNDDLYGWYDDELYFTTQRVFQQVEWDNEVYKVNMSGGTPERVLDAVGDMPTVSADGRFIAFTRGACRVAREQYKGPSDNEIWIYDTQNDKYIQITDNEMNDYLPRWSGNDLYFISAVSGRYNVVKQPMDDSGNPQGDFNALTNFTEDGVRHFDIAGDLMVMERKTSIYKMNAGGEAEEIDVDISTDYRFDPEERKTFSNGINDYAISPNGKLIALEIRGEIFVKQNDKEKSRSVNISNHPYRDQDPVWLNDSTILFTSDRDGQSDIYLVKSADENKTSLFKTLKLDVDKVSNTDDEESNLTISPDGKKLAYQVGRGMLKVSDIDEKGKLSNTKTLLDGWASPDDLSWSPDSKWLAYSLSDLNFNSEIYIHAADNSMEPQNVSMHPRGDRNPYWSTDGSKLGFSSNRNGGNYDVWFVWLKKEDWEKTKRDREEGYYFEEDEEEENKKEDKKDKDKKKEVEPIQIDFNRIYDRLSQVTSLPGNEWSFVIDKKGEMFYFTTSTGIDQGSDLYKVKWDGSEINQITKGGKRPGGLSYDASEDEVYFVSRGKMSKVKSDKETSLPHSAAMVIHNAQEREQIFEEAWRALNAGFYDPDFHGNDWEELKEKYKPWALAASTTQDFRYMYNIMLGQLNASHMGLYGSDPEEVQRERTGRLGIEVMPNSKGVEITHVVPNTPADRTKSKLNVGEVITAVNGVDIEDDTNFFSLFAEETDNQVLLEVEDNGKTREVVIRPSRSVRDDLYEEWVRERQELTEKYSNGKLGYIHIRGMNMPSFERFERELMASGLGKEGIVIDVRYNGGGWTTDYLMAVLNVRQHAYTIPRGAADNLEDDNEKFKNYYPFSERLPLSSWTKPSVAMCNEMSYSNAEIFSHAYKTLDIGTLVGKPTFGAVISTGGQGLIDGSFVRMPFRAWYVKATEENMEHGPAVPDIIVDNAPDSKADNEDPQLKKAVEVLLGEM